MLWWTLNLYDIHGDSEGAAQLLIEQPLANPAWEYAQCLERTASPFALQQYKLMTDTLIQNEWIKKLPEGGFDYGSHVMTDQLYNLPFALPQGGRVHD